MNRVAVSMRREGNVGYVILDNPPANAIDASMCQGLIDAVNWSEQQRLDRIIVSGAGNTFATGVDENEVDQTLAQPQLPAVLNAVEQSFVPWIAAINGSASGGGAELALACRMRIIGTGAQIGWPEVTRGLIPSAGGTQRMPRLVGLVPALDIIVSGKAINADVALANRLVDAIEEEPLEAAFMVNTEQLLCRVPTWELPAPVHDASAINSAKDNAHRIYPEQTAPQRAIEVIAAGLDMPFSDAMHLERQTYLALLKLE